MSSTLPLQPQDARRLAHYLAGDKNAIPDAAVLRDDRARLIAAAMLSDNDMVPLDGFLVAVDQFPDALAITVQVLANNLPKGKPEDPHPRFILHWAREALENPEEPQWIVDGLLSEGSVSILAGAPGQKKTFSAYDIALCVAMGTPWLGRKVKQGSVLILDEECGEPRLKSRLAKAMRAHQAGLDLPVAWISMAGIDLRDGVESADMPHLRDQISTVKPVLIVVDAFADIMCGGDESTVRDTQPVFRALRNLANQSRAAIVVIHHANRAGDYRGSSAIAGAVDLLQMIRSEQDSVHIDFRSEKARDTGPLHFGAEIKFDEVDNSVRLFAAGAASTKPAYTPAQEYVIQFLTENGPSLVSEIMKNAKGCTPSTARSAIYQLRDLGVVKLSEGYLKRKAARYELVSGVTPQ